MTLPLNLVFLNSISSRFLSINCLNLFTPLSVLQLFYTSYKTNVARVTLM